jgi:glycosyltransferase involved in cell wall biosynthesis
MGPLQVSFVVFAYNQERFIAEAVKGAFGQTYEPLQIVLSDDCSTDDTFRVMQALAAALGPRARLCEPLAPYTSMRVGGPADMLLTCRTTVEVVEAVRKRPAGGASRKPVGQGN